jgi:hypothetical protein
MIDSGKWGREITAVIGKTTSIKGSRGRTRITFVSGREAVKKTDVLHTGDIIFFIKSPDKKIGDEIVGHMGIAKREDGKVFLIHAGGIKNKGGKVKKVLLADYLNSMPFLGIRVSRFEASVSNPE